MLYRSNLLENSFTAMAGCSPRDWARDIMVMFHGEEGLDYGVRHFPAQFPPLGPF